MVSGAGGSIGSELCRQILRLGPARLVLFEISEVALYNIEREITTGREAHGFDRGVGCVARECHHKQRVREVMQAYGVQTVYHAAAYNMYHRRAEHRRRHS